MPIYSRTPAEVFDDWALDYHAPGMEDSHWPSVEEAFALIPESTGRYLEVGVGNGYGLYHMATRQYRNGSCLGIDVSENMVRLAGQRVEGLSNVSVQRVDFLDYHPVDERPDLIFSMEVFYYLLDIQSGIDHAMEILKPGGVLMILVNHYKEHVDSHAWPDQLDTRMQLWSASEYHSGLEKAGFSNIQQRRFGVVQDAVDGAGRPGGNPGTLGTWGTKPEV